MITTLLSFFLIVFLLAAILAYPTVCVAGAASGLYVWLNSALPSLFPFMVLTGLLIRSGIMKKLSVKAMQNPFLGKFPVTAIFATVSGLLCGYPMGVRTVRELYEDGQLSKRQAHTLNTFVNQPGPMFLLGYALPLCAPTPARKFMTAFYGGVILTALLALIIVAAARIFGRNMDAEKNSPTGTDAFDCGVLTGKPIQPGFFSVFEETLLSSMLTMAKIGGCMMIFSLLSALIAAWLPNYPSFCLLISGILEMTSGMSLAPALATEISPYFILGFAAFGGLSVAAQSFTLGKFTTREQLCYLFWKTIQTTITLILYSVIV